MKKLISRKTYYFFISLIAIFILFPRAVRAQFDRGSLFYSKINQIRSLIITSFYRQVSDETLVKGAFGKMKKTYPPLAKPSDYSWRSFTEIYLKTSSEKPEIAGILAEAAVEGMVDSLNDPYSVLINPQKRQLMKNGDGSIVGIEMGAKNGKTVVIAPLPGSPAEKAGIRSGDVITAINGLSVEKMNLYEASMLITGKCGEKIEFKIIRGGKRHTFYPVLSFFEIKPVHALMLAENIGYIKIALFNGKMFEKFLQDLTYMKRKKVRGLILDLRNNPGGDVNEALRVVARFVPQGVLAWSTKKNEPDFPLQSISGEVFPSKIVLLVNEGTASAAEIATAALSENKRAVTAGRRTFGKGVVQTVFKPTSETELYLTTEVYLTPEKNNFNGTGILPEIVLENSGLNPDPTKDSFVRYAWNYLKKG